MIRAEVREDGVALVGALDGAAVYVDRDWLPASSGPVPWLVVSLEGLQHAPDETAALGFVAVARAAAAEVAGLPPESVEVTGSGLIARLVRELVGAGAPTGAEAPRAVVETTGDPAAIADATRRTAGLGTIILAGEARDRPTELNLYPDVHLRGLTLVGIPPPAPVPDSSADSHGDESLLEICRGSLVHVRANQLLSSGAAWYCVSA